MPTRDELITALRNADAAGDSEAAQRFADQIHSMDTTKARSDFEALPTWQKPLKAADDILRLASNGVTFGFRDKLAQYVGGGTPEEERAKTADAQTRAGTAGSTAEIGASVLPMLATSGAAAGVPATGSALGDWLMAAGVAGAEGAGYSGIHAVGHDQPVIPAMGVGAATGVAAKAGADLLSAGFNKLSDMFTKNPARLSVDELRTMKDKAYQDVADEGVEYKPATVRGVLQDMDAASSTAYPGRHDETIAARSHLKKRLGTNRARSLTEMDLNRQIINRDVSGLPDPAQSSMGLDMVKAMDDRLNAAGPGDVTTRSGDPEAGIQYLNDARKLNSRMQKSEDLGILSDKARRAAARSINTGEDSTIRANIDSVLNTPKKSRGYTPDELAKMNEVVSGTPEQNFMRQVGRMAPGGGLGLTLGASGAGAAVGSALGGPVGMAIGGGIPPAVGYIAKKMSERGTKKSLNELLDLVASGGNAAAIAKPKLVGPKGKDALTKLLMSLGINNQ